MRLTYEQLAAQIAKMTPEQKKSNVTVFNDDEGEYYAVRTYVRFADDTDILDPGHPYLVIR